MIWRWPAYGDDMVIVRFLLRDLRNCPRTSGQQALSLQTRFTEFFEEYLRTLIGIEFFDLENSTEQRHSRHIDALGIESAGPPVVGGYKRRQDENIINQGLDCLAWLDDRRVEFRDLLWEKLGGARVTEIDFARPRLM